MQNKVQLIAYVNRLGGGTLRDLHGLPETCAVFDGLTARATAREMRVPGEADSV